jgi:hypothetical protein
VVLRQTSVAELKGKQLLLEQVRGIKGVLRDGDQYWDALLDYLSPSCAINRERRGADELHWRQDKNRGVLNHVNAQHPTLSPL